MVGITTAGARYDTSGQDSLCYQLYEYGKRIAAGEIEDASFFFAWWEPRDPDADFRDPKTWRQANPGYGDLVGAEDFESTMLRTPEAEFRMKRCNQFMSGLRSWLPFGAWDACADRDLAIEDGTEVCLGFDGSFNNDSTAIVVASCDEVPHLEVVACWERPPDAGPGWAVPIADVEQAIRDACRRYYVREIVCDPFRWARTLQALEEEGLPMVEYPQSPQRMTPATQRFYEAVVNRQLTHSGDPRLGRHMDAAVLKVDARAGSASPRRLVQRSIDGLAERLRLVEQHRSHTRKVATPTDRIGVKALRYNAIRANTSTSPSPSTNFKKSPNRP